MLTCTLVTEGNLLGTTSRKFQSCTSVLHLRRVPLSCTTKHSPQAKTTQFGVLVCQNIILLLKAVQKRSPKIKIKNQNIKFRWWNSWQAADFSNTTAPIVVPNPPHHSKIKKFPHLREMVQAVLATFASRNAQIYYKNHQS